MLKPWTCKVSQIIRYLIKPLFKNSTKTFFRGGTPWVTQILNNVIVSMVPIVHKTFAVKKQKTFLNLSLGKSGSPFTLESHIHVKTLKMQGFLSI